MRNSYFSLFHFSLFTCAAHTAQPILSPDEAEVIFTVALAQQATGDVDEFRGRSQAWHTAVAIEVRADAYVLNAHHLNSMVQVGNSIKDGGLPISAQEAVVEGYLHDAIFGGQRSHLLVGEVGELHVGPGRKAGVCHVYIDS